MIALRKAGPDDLPRVFELIQELEGCSDGKMDFDAFASVYLQNYVDPNVCYLLAIDSGDEAIGFGSMHMQRLLHHGGLVAEVQELIVVEECRGRGIGKQLLAALEDEARRQGCRQIEICCNMKRIDSNEFYDLQGYPKTHYKHVKII